MNSFDFVRPATVARWTFDDEDGMDSGPNGNDLTLGDPSYGLGRFGQCIIFDGSTYLRSDYPSYTSLQLSDLSAFFWMKAAGSDYQTIFSFEDYDSALYGFQFGIWNSKLFFSESSGAIHDPNHIGNSTAAVDGEWHWIAFTRGDEEYTRFYIDGLLDYEAWVDPLTYNGYELACAGAWWYDVGSVAYDFFTGSLDDLHIISTELSHATIRKMYAFQMGRI